MELLQIKAFLHWLPLRRQVYLDHNATTRLSRPVRRWMKHVLKHRYGNPSSLYGPGRDAAEVILEARQQVATAIHAHPREVYFTGCASESNNAVL